MIEDGRGHAAARGRRPTEPFDGAGALARVRTAKIQIARALLAVRRVDRCAAETHLVNAQRDLHAAEVDLARELGEHR